MNPLNTGIQHQSESLEEYGADIERLAYPDAAEQFTHHLGASNFIDGVHNIQLQLDKETLQ